MGGPEAHFRQLVRYAEVTGRDAWGTPLLGPIQAAAARIQPSRKLIRDSNGAEFVASFVVYTAAPITLRHRLWFAGDDTTDINHARRPAAVDEHVDGGGVVRYRKVWL
ncbi:hypothetical protein FJV41_22445 [Myxococcus llanfairpwllgwyngyllgogerychwyrndrobwllllantysiliogogogochensis]|uniref:Uncharacterized protein n=1 Tax=Myxococcus llanfairpwllgwyngyllgogerychwyrndrobwllllantysiliogogogochensis TaxID=2590453 RepID=A0A540WXL0_9BACT|nr:hypothetical protein [Myxococcus llanfairpwllgwyngyllgogerychwyrndrobwllllantysiliogogogochensis]TQF13733.1 hypothetical protein FJV41_22445 [Myxococcus llanfairpwllgwyngyllgogerychwyrndrobwllllantysiliogogogochensis]